MASPIFVLDLVDTVNKEPLEKLSVSVAWVLAFHQEDMEVAEAGCAVLWLLSLMGEQSEALVNREGEPGHTDKACSLQAA